MSATTTATSSPVALFLTKTLAGAVIVPALAFLFDKLATVLRLPAPVAVRGEAVLTPVDWDPVPALFHLRVTGDRQAGYTIGGAILRDRHERGFAEAMFLTSALILWRPD